AATQTFSWTPTYEQAGTYTVTFGVKDPAGLTDETQTTITVENVNRPPVLAEVGTIQGKENETITFTLSASDPDKEDAGKLTFRAENMPEGATLDSKSGVFQWVPTYDQSGTYTPVFIVSDGDLSDSSQVTIMVENVNRPPVIAEIGPQEVDENSPLKFTVQASDPDKEDAGKLQLSASALPEGATFDPATGQFQWTPTFEQAGEYTVTFTVQDAEGATASQSVTITVHNVNRPPQLAEIAPQTVKENEPLTVTFTATDPDNEDAGKLTFQASPMPEGAQLDAASGQFQWTPNFEQAGKYDLTVTVRDPGGATDSKPFTITVENVNRPPAISVKSEYKVKEGEPLEFTVAGNDPDAGDKLTFSASGLPPGATFDAASGVFRWTPGSNDQGSYTVEFAVKDAAGASATATVTIVVEDVPQPEGENKPQ
ncbi:MAG TPA: tandem-95 repeat protein, partial [Calditrichae bacterium]|nr:tandem-95 repeat protein [Calditrichia bacterium]